ncbi:cytochrome c [Winogradskyella eckloniae]|uniref:c-type cytochrome n=1 Tax=Winogradskyella eckloniae TaxID=1089306 RepID=UPI001563AD98|nr:cytochrome c [Winogradskyella eckloniae]NRD20501.1 cytochrome c [Winogradskyella eckloniae]
MKNYALILTLLFLLIACHSKEKKQNYISENQDQSSLKESIKRGSVVYDDFCISCHLPNGKGIPKVFPPLANSDYLKNNQIKSIKAIKYGLTGKITVNGTSYNGTMTALGLSDEEVTDVTNYINNSWDNKIDNFVTSEKVSKL